MTGEQLDALRQLLTMHFPYILITKQLRDLIDQYQRKKALLLMHMLTLHRQLPIWPIRQKRCGVTFMLGYNLHLVSEGKI
jgi:hypothetical protein